MYVCQRIISVRDSSVDFVLILAKSLLAVYFILASYGIPVRQKKTKLMSHLQGVEPELSPFTTVEGDSSGSAPCRYVIP